MNKPNNMLYLDIETASKYSSSLDMKEKNELLYNILENKVLDIDSYYNEKSSLNPVYGQITCLTLGYFVDDELVLKSFTGNEKDILENAYTGIVNASRAQYMLCGYNILNFDIPWLNIKMMKYGMEVPNLLSVIDKKPWDMNVFDIYSQINMKNISLIEMCTELNIDIPVHSGKEMSKYYWNGEIDKIQEHCESDVKATVQLYKIIYKQKQKQR